MRIIIRKVTVLAAVPAMLFAVSACGREKPSVSIADPESAVLQTEFSEVTGVSLSVTEEPVVSETTTAELPQDPVFPSEEHDPESEESASEQTEQTQLHKNASGFVLVSEAVPDVLLEIRYYSTYNFVGERIRGYEEPVALLTAEAAEALRQASDELAEQGYRLKIYDAYRPKQAVAHFTEWAENQNDTRMQQFFYPELNKDMIFSLGYVSRRSSHSRGSTVDLTLFDMNTEKEADMGGTYDYFGERSHTYFSGITAEQQENRMRLRNAMTNNGFDPLDSEWWHFTLKDEPYSDTYFDFPVSSSQFRT